MILKRYFTLITISLIFAFCSNTFAKTWYEDKPQNIEIIKEDISLLNLVNVLGLNKKQITVIIDQASKAEKIQKDFRRDIRSINKKYLNELEGLKKILEQGLTIPQEIEDRVEFVKKEQHKVINDYYEQINQSQGKITEILEAEQIFLIEDFQPCVIPPKDLTNPVRAGQSESNVAEIENLIKDLRDLPDDIYVYLSDRVLNQIITETELIFGKLNEEDRKKEKRRLTNIVNRARQMNDMDFAVEKESLAKQFVKRSDNVITKLNELSDFESQIHGGITKIGKYLLNPRIIPLLRPRLNDSFQVQKMQKIQQKSNLIKNRKNSHNKKVSFEEFANDISLKTDQRIAAIECIHKGQIEFWETIRIPRKDKIDIIKSIQGIEQNKNNGNRNQKSMLEILSLKVPDTNTTYFEVMDNIEKEMESNLKKILSKQQFDTYKASKIRLFDVKLER